MSRSPSIARWALRLTSVSDETRDEVEADLLELFDARRAERGAVHAHWRLYRDIASLLPQPHPHVQSGTPSPALALLRDTGGDVRYAVRLFARQPGILLLTIVGLSLGLGIATSAFSITNVALRGEGLRDSARVPGVLRTTDTSTSTAWRYDEFIRLRQGAARIEIEAVVTDTAPVRTTTMQGEAPSTGVAFVSGGFFAATGGHVSFGRALEAADEAPAGAPPVVVSFVFWTSRLDRDPAAIGRTIRIGRTDATIVGVADREFTLPNSRLLWMPLTAYGSVYGARARTPEAGVQIFGRLLPGVSLAEAEGQISGVAATLPRDGRQSVPRARLDTHAGLGRVPRSEKVATATFVFAVIALVLLLACANVATVLVATAITREREMGVRAALGATRWRIVRQLITESLALGTVASVIGLLFAYWAIPVMARMIEAPAGSDLAPDLTVFLFLGLVTLGTGVGAGLAPARHSRDADLVAPLTGEGGGRNRVAPRRLRSALVMTQAAVSVLLIVLAALFVRATFRAATVDVGFDAEALYAVAPGLGDPFQGDGTAIRSFWARALPELRAVPGVTGAALVEFSPFDGMTRTALTGAEPKRIVYFNRTGSEYFGAMRLRVIAGRTFTSGEIATDAPVALISESLARAYWQGQSPLGQLLPADVPVPALTPSPARPMVIGVVSDAITARLNERNVLAVYQPLDPANHRFAGLVMRVDPGSTGALQRASQRLRAIDPQADIRIESLASRVEQEAGRPRMLATLTGVVGTVAIVLCVIGLYGLTASLVGQRTREMGIRAALGAEPRDLLRLLMWDSLRPVVMGLVFGAATALAVSRVVAAAMLFGVSPQDPIAFAGAAAILLAAATLAVVVPTRRGSAVDAAVVLKQ